MSEPLLTARQVAELLGVSAETVLRWTRRGELPAIRLPSGAIRYRPDGLDRWLLDRTTTAGDATEECHLPQSATRQGEAYGEVSSVESPVPLRDLAARTEEEPHAR